ncbi:MULTISPECIES: head GIN domain-containing protein [unclassified Cellulophaga]|uniref:head GIN domain-containing protein n=1 Tax=unclassified Cellulophaga TaxID=2634405 RepID=UPI0026E36638|nr:MULTISPECIES: head GIN domain-containing protein [unclassified Cellulophaga]MDO6490390.1 head GIN domain-containing protein [Cellulophaga sp. 2_MG-2023]MDO6494416.1 head GIN domain-containing protein [Cellulophaga sp. 3_MG-2023]
MITRRQIKNIGLQITSKSILLYTLTLVLVYGCNSENASDCFQNAGDTIREEIVVEPFTAITVFENSALVIKEGPVQKVEVETGEYLRSDIDAKVVDGKLILTNTNGCNFTRDYGLTTFYVTAPNLTSIRSSTGFDISSDGVLSYPSLALLSEDFGDTEADFTTGSFTLELLDTKVSIVSNGAAYFDLKGTAKSLNVVFAAGDSRLNAENLITKNVNVNHRSSNDILVNPQESISGTIRGVGDVISYYKPANINVEELYKGKLIFKE